jgi:1-acyl-sn-glycerol-3-phosphate acyltransferase
MIFLWPFFLYKRYGRKDYKLEGGTIIVANHYSTFDPYFIYMIYRKKRIYFVTIKEAKKRLLSRLATWLFDCIFIDNESNHVLFFRQCVKVLKNDGILCIFPEGEINPQKAGFFDFKPAFILLAKRTKSKILPLYIYPELVAFKHSKIYIGDVITCEEISKYEDVEYACAFVQSKIMDYSTEFNSGENLLAEMENNAT